MDWSSVLAAEYCLHHVSRYGRESTEQDHVAAEDHQWESPFEPSGHVSWATGSNAQAAGIDLSKKQHSAERQDEAY